MSNGPDHIEGCSLTTGLVRYRDLGYVVGTLDRLVEDDVPHSRIFERDAGTWGAMHLLWTICSATVTHFPSERALFLGVDGEIQALGGGQVVEEPPIADPAFSPADRGPLREIRAVGGRAYAVGTLRQAYRRDGPGQWTCIDQTAQTPVIDITETSFESTDGFDEHEIYAVGWEGEIWQYDGTRWTQRDSPTNLALYKVRCATDGSVYACGQNGLLLKGRGASWTVIDHGATDEDLWGMAWFESNLYLSSTHFVFRLNGTALERVDFDDDVPDTCYHLSTADGIMWSIGARDVMEFNGLTWSRILKL